MTDTHFQGRTNCLGQTCMQWQSNGELSAKDRHLVFEQLLQAEGCSSAWGECWVISVERTLAVSQTGRYTVGGTWAAIAMGR